MNLWLAVALGGALGSMARYGGVRWLTPPTSAFPWGTLAVNVVGSFLAGALYIWLVERGAGNETWRALIMVGFLGGFTTFSAFSVETLRLLQAGALPAAMGNVLASVGICLSAGALGMWLARHAA